MIMIQNRYRIAALVLFLALGATISQAQTPEIFFTVSMPEPHKHMLNVEMRINFPRLENPYVDLIMPVWTPGSYLIREYARHVQDFLVEDTEGKKGSWSKINKHTWRVAATGSKAYRISYRVYANEFTVRSSEVNESHAFLNPPGLFMYPDGYIQSPSTVKIVAPSGWSVATGLEPAAMGPNTFRAENFDILYDSPIEAGTFRSLTFNVRGVPHRIVIDGEGNHDPERIRRDIQRVVESSIKLMGDIPYRDYTFIIHLRQARGGLEHLNSTAIIYPRFGFSPESSYRDFLSLVSHEFFHLWNVKRIRPDTLGPFDYTKENYTKLLWVAEGITSYYEDIILRRAALMTEAEYLANVTKVIQIVQNTPGRRAMSLEESSFDTWIKYYRQDENSINTQISYYDKGQLVGLLLDLEIRNRTQNRASLDDVMRQLYADSKKGKNYTPEDFERIAEQVAGSSLDQFFQAYVRGREELDYNRYLGYAGLRLDTASAIAARAWLGAELRQEGDRLVVSRIPVDSPAHTHGLNAGDQIVALDGFRVTNETLSARLDDKKPNDTVELTIIRFDQLKTIKVKLGSRPLSDYRIVKIPGATAQQTETYNRWIGG